MRDALSLLDRLLSVGEKHVNVELVEQLLGLPKAQMLFDLAEAIAGGDVPNTLGRADAIVQSGMSVDSLLAALVDHLHNLLILRTCGSSSDLVEVPGLAKAEMDAQAKKSSTRQSSCRTSRSSKSSAAPSANRKLAELCSMRRWFGWALADQFASVGQLLSNLDSPESEPGSMTPES